MVATRHSLPRLSSVTATSSLVPTTTSAQNNNNNTNNNTSSTEGAAGEDHNTDSPLTILPTDDPVTVKRKRALQKSLAIDGTDTLKGDRRKPTQVSDTEVYHFRGATYEIPKDQNIPREWIENQPQRYKKRKMQSSMSGQASWGSLSFASPVPQMDGVYESGKRGAGDDVDMGGDDEEVTAAAEGAHGGLTHYSPKPTIRAPFSDHLRRRARSAGDDDEQSVGDGASNDNHTASIIDDDGDDPMDLTEETDDDESIEEIPADASDLKNRRASDPGPAKTANNDARRQTLPSFVATSSVREYQDELNDKGQPKRKITAGLAAYNARRSAEKQQKDKENADLMARKLRLRKVRAEHKAEMAAFKAKQDAEKVAAKSVRKRGKTQAPATTDAPASPAKATRASHATPEQRRAQTENARKARMAKAAARRLEKSDGVGKRTASEKRSVTTRATRSSNSLQDTQEDNDFTPTKQDAAFVTHDAAPLAVTTESTTHSTTHPTTNTTTKTVATALPATSLTRPATAPSATRYGYNEDAYYAPGYIPEQDGRRRLDHARKHALADAALASIIAEGKRASAAKGFATTPLPPPNPETSNLFVAAAFIPPGPQRARALRLTKEARAAGVDFNDPEALEAFAKRDGVRADVSQALAALGRSGDEVERAEGAFGKSLEVWKSSLGSKAGGAAPAAQDGDVVDGETRGANDGARDVTVPATTTPSPATDTPAPAAPAPFGLPSTNKAGQPLKWSLSRRIDDQGSAQFSIQHGRLDGESAKSRRRRIRREVAVLRAWEGVGPGASEGDGGEGEGDGGME
ncbi:hypothetical protein MBLNU230_g5550t1 [Neophaeotheca triangularis]